MQDYTKSFTFLSTSHCLPGLFMDSHLLVSERINLINNQPATSTNHSYFSIFWPKHATELYFKTVSFSAKDAEGISIL